MNDDVSIQPGYRGIREPHAQVMVWLAWINDAHTLVRYAGHLYPLRAIIFYRHNLSTCFVALISSEYELRFFRKLMLFGKTGSRRIDKGSILEDNTGNSAGDYHGCNF